MSSENGMIGNISDNFGDVEAMFNCRKWLEEAVKAKGAKVTGGGMGMGTADVDIKLDGFDFVVSIRPMRM